MSDYGKDRVLIKQTASELSKVLLLPVLFFLREHRVDDLGRQCKSVNFQEGTVSLCGTT